MSYKRNQSLIFLTIIESNVGVCFKAAFLRVSNACRIDVCLCTIFETGLGFQTTAHWQRYFLIHHYNHVICNNGNFNGRINFDINNIHFIIFSWRILFFKVVRYEYQWLVTSICPNKSMKLCIFSSASNYVNKNMAWALFTITE